MTKLLALFALPIVFSLSNVYAGTNSAVNENSLFPQSNQQIISTTVTFSKSGALITDRTIPVKAFKRNAISNKQRITYTNAWLDELSAACKVSFCRWYEWQVDKYAIEKISYEKSALRTYKYQKLKESALEYDDLTDVDFEAAYNAFTTSKNVTQLANNRAVNKKFNFSPYPSKQFWTNLSSLDGNSFYKTDGPGYPEMALDEETVRQFLYKRTDSGELESLPLCFVEPKYSLILGRAIGKFGRSATTAELWSFINPERLLADTNEFNRSLKDTGS